MTLDGSKVRPLIFAAAAQSKASDSPIAVGTIRVTFSRCKLERVKIGSERRPTLHDATHSAAPGTHYAKLGPVHYDKPRMAFRVVKDSEQAPWATFVFVYGGRELDRDQMHAIVHQPKLVKQSATRSSSWFNKLFVEPDPIVQPERKSSLMRTSETNEPTRKSSLLRTSETSDESSKPTRKASLLRSIARARSASVGGQSTASST